MRRRRYDPARDWDANTRTFIVRDRARVPPAEQRRALLRLVKYMALVWILCALVFYAWSVRFGPAFDTRSPAAWVQAITTGEPAERAAALLALSESDVLPRVSCRVLGDQLRDTTLVREAAVFTLIKAARGGRCVGVVLHALETAPAIEAREAAAQILTGAGPAVRAAAVAPLLRVLQREPSMSGGAATALASIGDTTDAVWRALARAFELSHGAGRGRVLEALVELFPRQPAVHALARRALTDDDADVRAAAAGVIDRLRDRI